MQLDGQRAHRYPFLGSCCRADWWTDSVEIYSLIPDRSDMPPVLSSQLPPAVQDASRSKKLQLLGILSGFAAGAWLGAAEAPTKLVSIGISPMVLSLIMVIGVFLPPWSLPALIPSTSSLRPPIR